MRILVLGGGISGLTTARKLSQLCPKAEITLLEKSRRLGGWIDTADAGGFLFEKGPRTFSAARSPHLLKLISEVGLESELLFSSPSAKKRYLWYGEELKSAGVLFLPHLWRLFREPFVSKSVGDETVYSFATRRFGKKVADLFFDPITLGIYAGDSRTLSVQACFPKFVEMEQRWGSLVLGMFYSLCLKAILKNRTKGSCSNEKRGALFTLRRGMRSLIDALVEQLNIEVVTDAEIQALYRRQGEWRVETKSGSFFADVLFSALPAHSLRRLLPEMPEISSSSLYLVNLGFHQRPAALKSGYGYLVPSNQKNETLLGMIWDSELFGGPCRMTAMVRADVSCPAQAVSDALRRHLAIHHLPDRMEISKIEQAIPQLGIGQKEKLLAWEETLSGRLFLSGNYMEGPSVEQCIVRSEKIVTHYFAAFV